MEAGVRDIASYNEMSGIKALPHILIVTFYTFSDEQIDDMITLIAGQGTRTGIHNIIVVDRTDAKSLPTNIKSSIPARIVYRLSSAEESRAIGVSGAEKLGQGEIIYKPNFGTPEKLNAVFTPEVNVKEVVEAVKKSTIGS